MKAIGDKLCHICRASNDRPTATRSAEIESKSRLIRIRFVYFTAAVIIVLAGLASRRLREHLPAFLAEYAGDTLWALMLFLLVSAVLADQPLTLRTATAIALAFLVEISQLYHAPWIDSIRQTTLGGLVLGFGFLWTDLVCYSVGIAMGVVAELRINSRMDRFMEA